MITNKGRALNILFERLQRAANSKHEGWNEEESLKSVRPTFVLPTDFGLWPNH